MGLKGEAGNSMQTKPCIVYRKGRKGRKEGTGRKKNTEGGYRKEGKKGRRIVY